MSTLSQLRLFLNGRLDLQRTGGVLFQRDDTTLLMTDVSVFTQSHVKLLESSFPHVSFSVLACETSTSGFIVVFSSCTEHDRAWHRCVVRLLLHIVCFLGTATASYTY
jgi:hypothetical protein